MNMKFRKSSASQQLPVKIVQVIKLAGILQNFSLKFLHNFLIQQQPAKYTFCAALLVQRFDSFIKRTKNCISSWPIM